MIVPFNFVIYEKVSRQGDALGIECGFYLKENDEAHEAVNKCLNSANCPNLSLQDAVDADAAYWVNAQSDDMIPFLFVFVLWERL